MSRFIAGLSSLLTSLAAVLLLVGLAAECNVAFASEKPGAASPFIPKCITTDCIFKDCDPNAANCGLGTCTSNLFPCQCSCKRDPVSDQCYCL